MTEEVAETTSILASPSFWGLVGVVLGFVLGEGARFVQQKLRLWRLHRALKAELKSVQPQINQKIDIIDQAMERLKNSRFLPMLSIPMLSTVYRANFAELHECLTDIERNCVHNIYERLLLSDRVFESFESAFTSAVKDKVMDNPFQAFYDKLDDIKHGLLIAKTLIDGYLEGKPEDVYRVGESSNNQPQATQKPRV